MLASMVTSLVLTLIIELSVLWLLGLRGRKNYQIAVYANMLTNPPVVFVTNLAFIFYPSYAWFIVGFLEITLAFFVEAVIYRKFLTYRLLSPWVLSLIANLISFETGLVLSYFRWI